MTTDNAAANNEETDAIKVGTMHISQLKHGANFRGFKNFDLENFANTLTFGNKAVVIAPAWVTPEIGDDGEETGQYEILSGNRRYAGAKLLGERGLEVQPIPVVTVPRFIADDPKALVEARIKMDVSAKHLTAVEAFKGYHKLMEITIAEILAEKEIDPEDTAAIEAAHKKAFTKALKETNQRFGFDDKTSKVVRSAYAYWTIEQEWRDAYDADKFGSPYDVLSVRTMLATLQKKNDYQGGIEDFIALCWQAVQDRKGQSIMERDGTVARDAAIAQMKQDEVRAKLQANVSPENADAVEAVETLTEAIESGAISTETAAAAIEVVEGSGVELADVLEVAHESAAETTPKGQDVQITDTDLQRATARIRNEVASDDSDELDEATINVMRDEALDYAVAILVACIANPDEASKLIRKALKAKVNPYLEDMDNTALVAIHKAVEKTATTVLNVEKKFLKRVQTAKLAETLDPAVEMLESLPPKAEQEEIQF